MTPEMKRALRLNPRLRGALRKQQTALLDAVESDEPQSILEAARAWADAEKTAEADIEAKSASPRRHRVSFLVEESAYRDFCETAEEYGLEPSDVAREYCLSGHTFARLIWDTVQSGGSVGDWINISSSGPNIAELVLPQFRSRIS